MSKEFDLSSLENDTVYTPQQIGQMLKAKPRTIANAIRSGQLAGIELGPRTIRTTGAAVREWLATKQPMNLVASKQEAKSSPTDNGASTLSAQVKPVKDIVSRFL